MNRNIESHEQDAQRIEGSAESSHAPHEHTYPSKMVHGIQERDMRSRSKNFKELRKFGAVDFYGTTDPVEAET